MKIGVLGTGAAGQTLAAKFVAMGHDVMMGARAADNEKVLGFAGRTGGKAGTFAAAAAYGELVVNCTRGDTSLAMLSTLAAELDGKILIDVANPLDFSQGFPPHLTVSNTDSLGEQIQRALPGTFVVKSLNTVNASVMIEPSRVPGHHTVFVSGNDRHAKGRGDGFPPQPRLAIDRRSRRHHQRSRRRTDPAALDPALQRARHRRFQHRRDEGLAPGCSAL